ncbi:MAG: hypothetical protein J6K33_10480 [Alistipes sp.]|nr:hypothetical protein [Alistipes sp.]
MRKIFFAIIALAALVGCNTDMMEEVATTPQYLTTSLEVALDDQTRAYDENLKWSWESTDKIAALQLAGENKVNELALNNNGKFFNNKFEYATEEPATFVFVYPYDAYIDAETLGYVQTGVWTPTLVGTVEATTVDNIGSESIAMEHHSAAFEIRVWDENKTVRKAISAATITSESDFCNGTTATVEGLNTDTVVFNIAAGDFAFNLTLTATDGTTYTVAVPTKNFVLGKRTILNVQWKYPPTASYTVYSSYNSNDGSVSKNNGVDGRSIYVKNVAIQHIVSDAATLTLKRTYNGSALDDVALTVGQEWSANNLALGTYTFQLVLTDGDYTWSTPVSSIYVTGLPYTLNPAANDNWNAWSENGNVKWNNSDRGTAVRVGYAVGSSFNTGESYIQKSFFVPENTTVNVTSSGEVKGSKFFVTISTTNTLSVSGTTVGTTNVSGDKYAAFNYSKSVIMTSANPTIKHHNSNSTNTACTYVKTLTIKY